MVSWQQNSAIEESPGNLFSRTYHQLEVLARRHPPRVTQCSASLWSPCTVGVSDHRLVVGISHPQFPGSMYKVRCLRWSMIAHKPNNLVTWVKWVYERRDGATVFGKILEGRKAFIKRTHLLLHQLLVRTTQRPVRALSSSLVDNQTRKYQV